MSKETILSDIDDVPDALLGWNKRQKANFQRIWGLLQGTEESEIDEFRDKFFIWMIENVEGMKDRMAKYSFMKDGDIVPDAKLHEIATKFMSRLDTMITTSLTEFGSVLEDQVRELAKMHLQLSPAITSKYFLSMRDNIYLFLYDKLEVEQDSRECILWYQFLDAVARMHDEEQDRLGANMASGEKKGCCTIA